MGDLMDFKHRTVVGEDLSLSEATDLLGFLHTTYCSFWSNKEKILMSGSSLGENA